MSHGPDDLMRILADTLAAAIDRDVDRLAEATKPLYLEGDSADQYAFLLGLLHIVREKAFPKLAEDEFVALHTGEGADHGSVTYGRLLAAYANSDTESCLALWAAVQDQPRTMADVMATAIGHAASALRTGWQR